MVATSATRDAANAAEFRAMVVPTLGVAPEVVTGDEEARLSFAGAVRGLPADRRRRTWWWTSAAARPSSSWVTGEPWSRRSAWTSAASG